MDVWQTSVDVWHARIGQLCYRPVEDAECAQFWPSIIEEIESAGGLRRILATLPAGEPAAALADDLRDDLREVYQMANSWMDLRESVSRAAMEVLAQTGQLGLR